MKTIEGIVDQSAILVVVVLLTCAVIIIFNVLTGGASADTNPMDCAEFANFSVANLPARCLAYWMNQ